MIITLTPAPSTPLAPADAPEALADFAGALADKSAEAEDDNVLGGPDEKDLPPAATALPIDIATPDQQISIVTWLQSLLNRGDAEAAAAENATNTSAETPTLQSPATAVSEKPEVNPNPPGVEIDAAPQPVAGALAEIGIADGVEGVTDPDDKPTVDAGVPASEAVRSETEGSETADGLRDVIEPWAAQETTSIAAPDTHDRSQVDVTEVGSHPETVADLAESAVADTSPIKPESDATPASMNPQLQTSSALGVDGGDAAILDTTSLTSVQSSPRAQSGYVDSTTLRRVEAALEQLENSPPPRTLVLELGDNGGRIRLSSTAEGVHVNVQSDGGRERDSAWEDDLRRNLAEHGFNLNGGEQADDNTSDRSRSAGIATTRFVATDNDLRI